MELKMEVVGTPAHFVDLSMLLQKASTAIFKQESSNIDNKGFIDRHWAIYILYRGDTAIGFTSFTVNDYYGLRPTTIANDYLFVIEEERSSKAMLLFSLQMGAVCKSSGLPMEHYYSSEESRRLSKRLKGKRLFEAYVYEAEEIISVYEKLSSKFSKHLAKVDNNK